jgi:site-specific recombinase XerD
MLENLFCYRRVRERHKCAPFFEERERYLVYKEAQGCVRETLIRIARELLCIAVSFGGEGPTSPVISAGEIEEHATEWARKQCNNGRAGNPKWPRNYFIGQATDWFRFLDLLSEAPTESPWFSSYIEEFARFMASERGLSPTTIQVRRWHLKELLGWLEPQPQNIRAIGSTDIDRFLKSLAPRGWCRVSIAGSAAAIRAFFRYAAMRKWCAPAVADSIQSPRMFREENLPIGPSWSAIKALIDSTDTKDPLDIRDRAILQLFAVYGLRSAEVANLRLDQIDWGHDLITVRRTKQRHNEVYPLIDTVGNAVLAYIRTVRPHSARREVFLTIKAPLKPLTAGALYHAVSKRLKKLGIHSVRRGPHALRHACATQLLADGLSLKEIGDHLGHASATATCVYAKVDMPHLRQVATFNFGGEL